MVQKRRQSLAILYVEHALARKIKYDKIISDFADEKSRRSPTMQQAAVCRKKYRCFNQSHLLTRASRAITQGTQQICNGRMVR